MKQSKWLYVLLALFITTAICPITAWAADNEVTYLNREYDSHSKSVIETSQTVRDPLTTFPLMREGEYWYYAGESKTFESRITVPSNAIVNLIIGNGVTLNCKKGIEVASTAKLSIYAQPGETGKLIANSESYDAAIGSNDERTPSGPIRIYGCTVEATAGTDAAGIGGGNEVACGKVEIFGGDVTAKGGKYGAGIGDGDQSESAGGPIRIFGGTVHAEGGQEAAGIGTGDEPDYDFNGIEILGGDVHAQGGEEGAGIGGGSESRGGDITISGGTIHSKGGKDGAGIGGGYKRGPTKISISGGRMVADGGEDAAGIGEGYGATSDSGDGVVEITGGEQITATGGRLAAGIGGGFYNNTKMKIHISGGTITAFGGTDACGSAGIGSGSYESMDVGALGGGDFAGEIVISGGDVYAGGSGTTDGYYGGSGIGSGHGGNMTGTIKITGGTVRAKGDCGGAGIGAGADTIFGTGAEVEGTIEITGGEVEAYTFDAGRTDDVKAVVVGHGSGGSNNGTLKIGDLMCVTKGYSAVSLTQRASTCQSITNEHIRVKECDHYVPDCEYVDREQHKITCKTCLYTALEAHCYQNGECTLCGAEGYNVYYVLNGYAVYNKDQIYPGGTVTQPADPKVEGLIFCNWYQYESQDISVPYDFSAPINDDVILFAHWKALTGLIAYNKTTGEVMSGGKVRFGGQDSFKSLVSKEVELNETVQAECLPNEGYDFVGWAYPDDPDTILTNAETFGFGVSEETIFYAVFEKHEHSLRHFSYKAPECERYGSAEYWECTKCRKLFSDEACANEISADDTILPALEHDWAEPSYEWAADHSAVTASRVCKNDASHIEEETVESVSKVSKEATCAAKGETTYTVVFENEAFAPQSITIADIEEKGHAYSEPVWTWSEDHLAATATFTCERGDDVRTLTQDATQVEVSAATATEDQVVKYIISVTFDGKTYTAETENITVPGTATGEPDEGQTEGLCKWCGKDHSKNFWQRVVGFFHKIFYFFAHLFGLR